MKKTIGMALVITAILLANSQAHSAAFMKPGDIKGKSTVKKATHAILVSKKP